MTASDDIDRPPTTTMAQDSIHGSEKASHREVEKQQDTHEVYELTPEEDKQLLRKLDRL